MQVGGFGLGCVKLGSAGAGGPRAGVRLVHEALDQGVRFFDTADAYGAGTSERVIGEALRGRRHGVTIATKGGYRFAERSAGERALRNAVAPALRRARALRRAAPDVAPPVAATPDVATPDLATPDLATSDVLAPAAGAYAERDLSPAYLRTAVEGSLRRLGTDHVDIYQLHGPGEVCHDDVVSLMVDLRTEGKIGAFGVGLEALDRALDWLAVDGLAWMQLPFGVLDPEAGRTIIPAAHERGVRVIARGVFAAGLLAGGSPGAEALLRPEQRPLRAEVLQVAAAHGVEPLRLAAWFARSQPGVHTVLVGVSSSRHLEQNLAHLRADAPPGAALAALAATLARHIGAPLAPGAAEGVDDP